MKRVISAILVLAMALSISDVFALPLSAEGIRQTTSAAVTTALSEAADIMQWVADAAPA